LLPRTAPVLGGRPHVYSRRLIIDTISYVLVSGCAWRLVPHDLAPWSIAYQWFRAWTADGTWDRVHEVLRDRVRVADGRDPQPSASVQDRAGAKLVLTGARRRFPRLGLVWVDGGYVNTVDAGLVGWAARMEGIEVVAVPRRKGSRCCPAGGWWNGPSAGSRGADGWHGTTNARPPTPRRWSSSR
jgi:transposase